MKINKALAFVIVVTSVMSQAYFWEDWGKQSTPEERIKKEEIDLKYQERAADIDYKKQKAAQHGYEKSREKQADLDRKKAKLEIDRKRDRLKVERY